MSAANDGTLQKIGTGGIVAGCAGLVLGDVVTIERGGAEVARCRVEGQGRFRAQARILTRGRGRFPDGAEVASLYDAGDDGFGHAITLTRELRQRPASGAAPRSRL